MAEKLKNGGDGPLGDIIIAADKGQLDIVTALLESGIDPNTVDEIGTSALHNAAKRGHWHIARLLLEKKASPRIRDGNDATPLYQAIRAGHKHIVRLLLECDPSSCDFKEGVPYEPIHIAAVLGHADIVQLLLECNASTLNRARGELTALHLAAERGHHDVCEILLKHDKKLYRSLWDRWVGPSLEVYSVDSVGNTAFAYAVEKGHKQTVEVFLRHYPDLGKSRDRYKRPLFHQAVRTGDIDTVEAFLNHGTDIEMRHSDGRRALHVAVSTQSLHLSVYTKDVEMIQLLLARGAIVNVKDKYGDEPENLTRDPKICMILRNHAKAQSLGEVGAVAPTHSIPPPEYQE